MEGESVKCRYCGAETRAVRRKQDYKKSVEWRWVIGDGKYRWRWLIRFRPRNPPEKETLDVTMPLACAAVRGDLAELWPDFKRCIALVSLMLGRGYGAADLVLLASSGAIAIGECKGGDRRDPWRQLRRYEKGVCRQVESGRFWREVARSYARYGFPHLCYTVRHHRHFGAPDHWLAAVRRAWKSGRVRLFVVRGKREVKYRLQEARSGEGKVLAI